MEIQSIAAAASIRCPHGCLSESQACLGSHRVFIDSGNLSNFLRTKSSLRFPITFITCRLPYRSLHENSSPGISSGSYSQASRIGAESTVEALPLEPISSFKSMITKHDRLEKLKRKNVPRKKKQGKAATPPRDLFGRSSFQLCEVIFCSPFTSSNLVSNLQCVSRENLKELVVILNKVAVGLAGSGVAVMLFVASRMFPVNANFNNHMIISVACGLGLISLSLSMKRVTDAVNCMADTCTKSRSPKKEHLIRLQNELQRFAFKAFPLIVLCLIRFG